MSQPKFFIIEGIDNVGKSKLVSGLQYRLGPCTVIKFGKPICTLTRTAEQYQRDAFADAFALLGQCSLMEGFSPRIILDRFHLGEMVYAPLYRNYDGSYVLDYEKRAIDRYPHLDSLTRLILLTTSNMKIRLDDGHSFDHDRGHEEQLVFMNIFKKSRFANKRLIDVYDPESGGGWVESQSIIDTILTE